MNAIRKNFYREGQIKVTCISSGVTKTFSSIKDVHASCGISLYYLRQMYKGQREAILRGVNNLLFKVEFILPDKVVVLIPGWLSGEAYSFYSHTGAITFLGCSKSTYYNRIDLQPLGEKCLKPIKDVFGREWYPIFYQKKKEFNLNKE